MPGALSYPTTISFPIFGTVVTTLQADNATIATRVRTPIALTSAYQAEAAAKPTKSFSVRGYSKLNLDILYTGGAAEAAHSVEIKIEGSPDMVNFYRIPNETVSGGTSTLSAREWTFTGNAAAASTISIGLDVFYKFVRVSAKETGAVTNAGTIFCDVTLAGL